jgi:hypothetical protein
MNSCELCNYTSCTNYDLKRHLAGRLGRQTWLADLAVRLGRQTWPADLAGRLGRQTCFVKDGLKMA